MFIEAFIIGGGGGNQSEFSANAIVARKPERVCSKRHETKDPLPQSPRQHERCMKTIVGRMVMAGLDVVMQ